MSAVRRGKSPTLRPSWSRAASAATAAGRCDLRFRLEDGELEITVSSAGGQLFQTSHPIADRS